VRGFVLATVGRELKERLSGPGLRWVPDRLRELTEWSGLPVRRIAKAVGITDEALQSWLTGATVPPATALPLLADVFDVPLGCLFRLRQVGRGGVA
jgi:transcriptional regulator with XRE-family HTH domain